MRLGVRTAKRRPAAVRTAFNVAAILMPFADSHRRNLDRVRVSWCDAFFNVKIDYVP